MCVPPEGGMGYKKYKLRMGQSRFKSWLATPHPRVLRVIPFHGLFSIHPHLPGSVFFPLPSSTRHSMVKLLPTGAVFLNYRHPILVLHIFPSPGGLHSRQHRHPQGAVPWLRQVPSLSGSLFSHGPGTHLTRQCFACNAELTPFCTQEECSANIN